LRLDRTVSEIEVPRMSLSASHKQWTMRDCENNVLHEGKIGVGGMGEVHKVSLPLDMLTQDA